MFTFVGKKDKMTVICLILGLMRKTKTKWLLSQAIAATAERSDKIAATVSALVAVLLELTSAS